MICKLVAQDKQGNVQTDEQAMAIKRCLALLTSVRTYLDERRKLDASPDFDLFSEFCAEFSIREDLVENMKSLGGNLAADIKVVSKLLGARIEVQLVAAPDGLVH